MVITPKMAKTLDKVIEKVKSKRSINADGLKNVLETIFPTFIYYKDIESKKAKMKKKLTADEIADGLRNLLDEYNPIYCGENNYNK